MFSNIHQLWLAAQLVKTASAYRAGDSMNGGLMQGGMGKKNLPIPGQLQRMQVFSKSMTKAFGAPRSPYKALIPGETIRYTQMKRLNDILPSTRNTMVNRVKNTMAHPFAAPPQLPIKK